MCNIRKRFALFDRVFLRAQSSGWIRRLVEHVGWDLLTAGLATCGKLENSSW